MTRFEDHGMRWGWLAGLVLAVTPWALMAAEPDAEAVKFFETSVRPLLVEHCFKCHGAEKQWGGLRLDSRVAVLKGGETGAAVEPGDVKASRLILAVRRTDADLQMPPDDPLSERDVATLVRWVEMGAPFPESAAGPKARHRDPQHWAFQPPVKPAVPAVKNPAWLQNELDAFILARLEAEGLSPATPVDKQSLIRRVTFDLTGLPPTWDDVASFVNDNQPDAYVRLIDRLLASAAYGERWGRHWLDIARYADSNGLDENICHGNAWRYRDFVVAAFNRDEPYDHFLRLQLAGDLLTAEDDAQRSEQFIATGFLAIGPKVLAEVDQTKMQMDMVDEQIDAVGRALLGLTLGCARCHDHKFDPIDTVDYYALAGIFKSTRTMETYTKIARWHENTLPSETTRQMQAEYKAAVEASAAAIQKVIDAADATLPPEQRGLTEPAEREKHYTPEVQAELKTLREAKQKLEKTPPALPAAMGVRDEDAIIDIAVHVRGSHLKLGDVAPRGVPPVLKGPATPTFPKNASGRREFVQWLTDTQNPLTSRVFVNRLWRWHFGSGLVKSADNFGLLGERPSHPELLDWLAVRFMEDGWSIKSLHRLILLSATYQQSSTPHPQTADRDPENRLYGRANLRRLEAEAVRDSLLAVSERLDDQSGGSLLKVKNREFFFDHTSKDLTDYSSTRRTMYLPVVRNNVYDVLQLLDYPDAAVPSGNRNTSTVPPQALLMLNSDLVLQSSLGLADRLLPIADDAERVRQLHRIAYGRDATADEIRESLAVLPQLADSLTPTVADPQERQRQAWACLCQIALAANEFVYLR